MTEVVQRCAYCANKVADTFDHIPPKCIFGKPLPKDLIKIPCCSSCNKGFSKDDEYFMAFLCLIDKTSPNKYKYQLFEKLKRLKNRKGSAGFYKTLGQSIGQFTAMTSSGILLPNQPGIYVYQGRVRRSLERIVKGLVYRFIGRTTSELYVLLDSDLARIDPLSNMSVVDSIQLLGSEPTNNVGDGMVFRYKFAYPKLRPDFSAWMLTFFETFHVPVLCKHFDRINECP